MTRTKKSLIFFVFINVIFIFMLIYKQSLLTKLSYEQQILENTRHELRDELESLNKELYNLKNPKKIKKYAIDKLGMKKMNLNQAKKISLKEFNKTTTQPTTSLK